LWSTAILSHKGESYVIDSIPSSISSLQLHQNLSLTSLKLQLSRASSFVFLASIFFRVDKFSLAVKFKIASFYFWLVYFNPCFSEIRQYRNFIICLFEICRTQTSLEYFAPNNSLERHSCSVLLFNLRFFEEFLFEKAYLYLKKFRK